MLLAIDVGNTTTTLGVFSDKELICSWNIQTKEEKTADEYGILIRTLCNSAKIPFHKITDVVIGSVVPSVNIVLRKFCERFISKRPIFVGPGIKTGMPIFFDNPKEIGADRIANAVAAYERYKSATIVVDFGTAVTFDCISKKGEYIGGVIAPGIGISFDALFKKASRLPEVELVKPKTVIGKDTVSAIQSGIIYGYAGLVDGIVERIIKEMKASSVYVIGTGELSDFIAKESHFINEVDKFLTLKGLRIIFLRNR